MVKKMAGFCPLDKLHTSVSYAVPTLNADDLTFTLEPPASPEAIEAVQEN
jgi:hypothetical protein